MAERLIQAAQRAGRVAVGTAVSMFVLRVERLEDIGLQNAETTRWLSALNRVGPIFCTGLETSRAFISLSRGSAR